MVYKFFYKKSTSVTDKSAKGGGVNNVIKQNERLAEKLHKPIITKLEKIKAYSSFKQNIWGADLADMQLMSKFNNKGTKGCSFKR